MSNSGVWLHQGKSSLRFIPQTSSISSWRGREPSKTILISFCDCTFIGTNADPRGLPLAPISAVRKYILYIFRADYAPSFDLYLLSLPSFLPLLALTVLPPHKFWPSTCTQLNASSWSGGGASLSLLLFQILLLPHHHTIGAPCCARRLSPCNAMSFAASFPLLL